MIKKQEGCDKLLMIFSFIAAFLSVLVSVLKFELWLAGTQWMLVAIVLAVWAIYNQGCSCKK